MTLKVIKLNPANIDMEKIKEAAGLIDDGALVAFPTDTVYGIACRVEKGALDKLNKLKNRSPDKHFTLHIAESNEVDTYVPTVRLNAKKLIRKAWPGPLTIVFELDKAGIEKQRDKLGRDVFKNLYKNNSIGIRCPDHPVATALLKHTHYPVVAPSANLSGGSPALNGDQVLQRISDRIDVVLDAGRSQYGLNSTIVKIGKKGVELLRSGVFSEERLRTLSQIHILFVCTGNTCRSPMAEGMFRKYLAEKLNANIDELEKIGYKVSSAGIIGSVGFPATEQAVMACANRGIDIGSHFNKGLTKDLIKESDFIYVMERMHQEKIVAMDPGASNRCYLLEENGQIPDPIGRPQAFYNRCADRIERAVKKRISELKI